MLVSTSLRLSIVDNFLVDNKMQETMYPPEAFQEIENYLLMVLVVLENWDAYL